MLGQHLESELAVRKRQQGSSSIASPKESWGVIPRALHLLFGGVLSTHQGGATGSTGANGAANAADATIYCSYMQLYVAVLLCLGGGGQTDVCRCLPFRYNDRVFDLLYDLRNQQPLPIREEPGGKGVYVSGLSEYRVSNLEEVMRLLALGAKHRAIRATEYNEVCVYWCVRHDTQPLHEV